MDKPAAELPGPAQGERGGGGWGGGMEGSGEIRNKRKQKTHEGRRRANRHGTKERLEYISQSINYSDVSQKSTGARYWLLLLLCSCILMLLFFF